MTTTTTIETEEGVRRSVSYVLIELVDDDGWRAQDVRIVGTRDADRDLDVVEDGR